MGEFTGRPSDKAVDLSKVVPKVNEVTEKDEAKVGIQNVITFLEGFLSLISKNKSIYVYQDDGTLFIEDKKSGSSMGFNADEGYPPDAKTIKNTIKDFKKDLKS